MTYRQPTLVWFCNLLQTLVWVCRMRFVHTGWNRYAVCFDGVCIGAVQWNCGLWITSHGEPQKAFGTRLSAGLDLVRHHHA